MEPSVTDARLPTNDPRTIARDIPGILDSLFPQLVPGVVAHFNRRASAIEGCIPASQELIDRSALQHAMLFELAVAAGEQLISDRPLNWDSCLAIAVARQRRHFDAKVPDSLSSADTDAAETVATNLDKMLRHLQAKAGGSAIVCSPYIPGYQWIASGVGDFALGSQLVEVKCTNKRFSSSDYRQILMYWLLSYAASIEKGSTEWESAILLNPRLNLVLKLPFREVIDITSGGRSKVEIVATFSSMVGDRAFQLSRSNRDAPAQ